MLRARDLTVQYPGSIRPAVRGVSVEVAPGELVAIAGPNGSGKTTLIRAMLGLTPTASGTAEVEGRDVRQWRRGTLARAVGVVTQREEMVFPLRVSEMVLLGRYARLGPLSPVTDEDRAAVSSALARCDVSGLADRRVDELSGGELQRVRVARALAQEPRALVLDEPTASLDVRHEMQLFELIRDLASSGLAALIVTHQLNLAARFADQILLLDEGRTVAMGPPIAVLTHDTIARVFRWPVALTTWRDGSPQIVPLRPTEGS